MLREYRERKVKRRTQLFVEIVLSGHQRLHTPILQDNGKLHTPYSNITLIREIVLCHPPVGDMKPAAGGVINAVPVLIALATATATVAALTS